MKYPILFYEKNISNLLSAGLAQSVVKVNGPVKIAADNTLKYFFFIFPRK